MNKKIYLAIFFLLLAIAILNYDRLDGFVSKSFSNNAYETANVERIVDGDTIVANKTIIRMLGINTPEKSEKY